MAVLTEMQWACLNFLHGRTLPHGEMCIPFAPIVRGLKLDRASVRRSVRVLARKGLAEYYRGLWTEDGEPAGAGYCITPAGIKELSPLLPLD